MEHQHAAQNLQVEPSIENEFAERLKFEHDIISHRLTWLMTLNGFLVAAMGLISINHARVGESYFAFFTAISILGLSSNGSVLFSSWWATRAIQDASNTVAEWWTQRKMDDEALEDRRMRMRLYGRDPRFFYGYQRPTPSEWLHPWLLLPAIFSLAFLFAPQLGWRLSDDNRWNTSLGEMARDASWYWSLTPIVVILFFLVLILWDLKRHMETERWKMCHHSPPPARSIDSKTVTKQKAKKLYREERAFVRAWVKSNRDSKMFPKELVKMPKPFGRIPSSTYKKYWLDPTVQQERLSPKTGEDT